MNKKKIIIISSAILILLLILFFAWLFTQRNKAGVDIQEINPASKSFAPEFLSVAEKNKLNIPADLKIQAVVRDKTGELMVYKVIRNDQDIVNPAQAGSVIPPAK